MVPTFNLIWGLRWCNSPSTCEIVVDSPLHYRMIKKHNADIGFTRRLRVWCAGDTLDGWMSGG
ncbi:hypothetical protein B9Q03_08130 [Candidatus Marsarchaeota G2 archaeon OSP_D]|uniref:Uncharacterized protein n=1 Tax=Candidatus Marsarchaeota G2 archaeon OSP_D TaxID=1978157 RepID=A0A2R6ATU8_9ARCH|nr:MAG: hypothetical protein B9Q03_08130 [Candidatus Marsarchaeota G2 archaeon OSP_D]